MTFDFFTIDWYWKEKIFGVSLLSFNTEGETSPCSLFHFAYAEGYGFYLGLCYKDVLREFTL